MVAMPSRYRRRDEGMHQAETVLRKLAYEMRTARMAAGLSIRDVARATGVSRAQLGRVERAQAPGVPLRTLTVVFAVLGMRLSARPYPEGTPLRDAAQVRLLTRFQVRLPGMVRLRTEVPLRLDRDLRAWDGELSVGADTCKLEAETALYDLQATDRRIALKMADDGVERLILLVADTRRNRRVLREFRGLLAARYPLTTREILGELRAGRLPLRSGVVVL